jgi:predicted lipoprotein with Yx(FWY)xxD motif
MKKIFFRHKTLLLTAGILVIANAHTLAAMDVTLPYPAAVGLTDEGKKGFVFRRSPGNERLYIYDLDSVGRSFCNESCESIWSPVLAPASAGILGEWSVIRRDDGHLQWAYRGHPVYSLIGDAPDDPKGEGQEDGKWHLLPYER